MTETDLLIVRLSCQLRDREIALTAVRQENASLKAKVAELEAQASGERDNGD